MSSARQGQLMQVMSFRVFTCDDKLLLGEFLLDVSVWQPDPILTRTATVVSVLGVERKRC